MAESKITVADPRRKNEISRYRERSIEQLTVIFRTDAAMRWFTSNMTDEEHAAYLRKWFKTVTRACELSRGVFAEANDFDAIAIWLLPGQRADHVPTMLRAGILGVIWTLGLGGLKRMLWDYQHHADKMKANHLPRGQLYHYLFFIGTMESARGKGLASKLIKERQVIAAEEGLPIWLEASSAHARDVYARCGFDFKEQLTLGKGTHGTDGRRQDGGEGVAIYAMCWWPEGKKPGLVEKSGL